MNKYNILLERPDGTLYQVTETTETIHQALALCEDNEVVHGYEVLSIEKAGTSELLLLAVIGNDLKHIVQKSEGEDYWALDPTGLKPVLSTVDDNSFDSDWIKFASEDACKAYVRKIWA